LTAASSERVLVSPHCHEPWEEPGFIDRVVALRRRQDRALADRNALADRIFFDRSPVSIA
jgi:predicted ATPase